MAFVELNRSRFHYELDGPADAPVLVLSNSLGADVTMWEPQMPAFTRHVRVLRYDARGHGHSAVTPGPYTIEQLSRDVVALLDALEIPRASFCGLSMGGAVGLWLGLNAADRFEKIVVCNTATRFGAPEIWSARIEAVRKGGTAAVAQNVIERWFTEGYRARNPKGVEAIRRTLLSTLASGYIACCEAVRDVDLREAVAAIRLPTLVIAGTRDPATPPADGRFIAERIPGARYAELEAAHLSNLEQPEAFSDAVISFLRGGNDGRA